MSKYQVGDKVIDISSTILAKDTTVEGVVPRKWWHREQRYLIPLGIDGDVFNYRKENQLMPKPDTTVIGLVSLDPNGEVRYHKSAQDGTN